MIPWPSQRPSSPHKLKGVCRVSGGTDNKGNGHVVAKLMTTTFPLGAILMELSAQLELRGMLLDLAWAKREENVLADKVSNGFFDGS